MPCGRERTTARRRLPARSSAITAAPSDRRASATSSASSAARRSSRRAGRPRGRRALPPERRPARARPGRSRRRIPRPARRWLCAAVSRRTTRCRWAGSDPLVSRGSTESGVRLRLQGSRLLPSFGEARRAADRGRGATRRIRRGRRRRRSRCEPAGGAVPSGSSVRNSDRCPAAQSSAECPARPSPRRDRRTARDPHEVAVVLLAEVGLDLAAEIYWFRSHTILKPCSVRSGSTW